MHVCVDRVQDKKPLFPIPDVAPTQVYLLSEAYPQLEQMTKSQAAVLPSGELVYGRSVL